MPERARADGLTWAGDVREALRREGRRPTGMWPGTLSEARARAARLVDAQASAQEREGVARAVYAAARVGWLQKREADEEPEGEEE